MNKNLKIVCAPGIQINAQTVDELTIANQHYKKGGFDAYIKEVEGIFGLTPINGVSKEEASYLNGFIQGEGSFNVSAKKHKNARFGLLIDLEFSVTQHVTGVETLHGIMGALRSGRLRHKAGSNATLVLVIDNRENVRKVIKFVRDNACKFQSSIKAERIEKFEKICDLFDQNAHQDRNRLVHEILPLWDQLRMQKGQANETFKDLAEAQHYVLNFKKP